ncbi:MAG TPA: hypothetical protein VES66_08955 [Terriglobales bacterium]|nr:hypothetical protein [Terriglobales bacterium]
MMVLIAMLSMAASAYAQLDVPTIIKRSVEVSNADWEAAPQYDHFERDRQPDGSTKTYEVMMILGSDYQRLVAVNDKPLTPEEQAREQRKLEQVIAQRQSESKEQWTQRTAKYEKDRKRDHLLMEQLTVAFDFNLLGEQKMGPYDVYVLQATPRPGYRPPNTETKVLTGMQGKLWIDKQTYQWVRVEAEVVHPVSIAGFLAQVQPGTRFELEKMPVAEGLWLPKHFSMKARAKILFFFSHKTQEDETYFDYHKAALSGTANP